MTLITKSEREEEVIAGQISLLKYARLSFTLARSLELLREAIFRMPDSPIFRKELEVFLATVDGEGK